ncbi:serine protease [Lentzea sp. BCCO 10_0856]|uniref:Serine protease n=1 Tax=Lentzea miocenica TaxID=3095431 RepID=A0ABU4T6K2_9PSEU|nr:serine protease [Lentzea sp. BCCO 10_0856]MDX8033798.1 serine protease [Lentzea sp. BCCO 10_0856]
MRRLLVLVLSALLASTGTAAADEQVVGGERASIEVNPWAVYLTDDRGALFCGGTIVAPAKVLTAAHCALGRSPADLRVVAGREDRHDREAGMSVTVSEIWIHKQYVSADEGEDVAVLTLKKALPYTPLPIAELSDRELYQPGTQLRALGWGRTSENGKTSRYLMQATVPVLPDDFCVDAYPQFVKTDMFCAGYEGGRIDTCQGDSGGPIVVAGKLVGVTSWGEGCARRGKPGVYVRLSRYAKDLHPIVDALPPVVTDP